MKVRGFARRLSFVLAVFALPAAAKDRRVDAVLAAVDGHPILASEVRARAKPELLTIHSSMPKEKWSDAEASLGKKLLELIVRERLIQADCDRLHLRVEETEVDLGVKAVADNAKITVKDLYAEVVKHGLDERAYRDELRRQILELKWQRVRLQPGTKVEDLIEKLKTTYFVERDLA